MGYTVGKIDIVTVIAWMVTLGVVLVIFFRDIISLNRCAGIPSSETSAMAIAGSQ